MACTCIKKQVGKGKGKVQGFVVTTLCDECEVARAASAIESAKQKEDQDVQILIAEKSQKIAKDALVAEGKLELKNGKLKKK